MNIFKPSLDYDLEAMASLLQKTNPSPVEQHILDSLTQIEKEILRLRFKGYTLRKTSELLYSRGILNQAGRPYAKESIRQRQAKAITKLHKKMKTTLRWGKF